MPALGNRGVVSPREISKAAKLPAPRARELPPTKNGPVFHGPLDSHPAFQRQPTGLNSPAHTAPAKVAPHLNQRIAEIAQAEKETGHGSHPLQHLLGEAKRQPTPKFSAEGHKTGGVRPAGGSPLATIFNIPARIEAQGYANLASATGLPQIKKVGNLVAEGVNLPTQALPAAYTLGHALGQARSGHSAELHELGKQFVRESAVAHIVKGDFAGAVKAAGSHPLGTALEVGGGVAAVDRALGAVGRLSEADAAALADKGATNVSRQPRPLPPTHAPEGGVTVPQRPYGKGLVRAKLERRLSASELSQPKASKALKRNFDQFEAEQLGASRATREMVSARHRELLRASRTRSIPGKGAVRPFTLGLLADPKVLDEVGQPLYRKQLADAIEHFSQKPGGEFPEHTATREAAVAHLRDLQASRKFETNPHAAYKTALAIAKDKRGLEPELRQHRVYTGETMRAAKLIPAFRFHFRDQDPFVDTSVPKGESPFSIAKPAAPRATERLVAAGEHRTPTPAERVISPAETRPTERQALSVSQVAKMLEAKGIHEDQLAFATTKPHQSETAAFRTGRVAGGAREATGHLTGHALMRGQVDLSPESLLRQHLTDAGIINKARGDTEFARRYVLKNEDVAKLIEGHMGAVTPEQKVALRDYAAGHLRDQKDLYFGHSGNTSPWQKAKDAQAHLKALGIDLRPVRVAHQFATKEYRAGLGSTLDVADLQDRLNPENFNPEGSWQTRLPTEESAQHDVSAGPVGLVHPDIAKKVAEYEKDLGQAHLARMPGSFWRKMNVAFSIRHVPGVAQEVGIRAGVNNIGPLSMIRGTRINSFLKDYADQHPDPQVKLGYQRVQHAMGGTVAGFTSSQGKHIPFRQLEGTVLERPAKWWVNGETKKLSGAPLRAIRGAAKGMNRGTEAILRVERKGIEHPPQIAGAGKHYNEEFKRITGKHLKVIGAFNDVEKSFLRGQFDPKAIDHFAAMSKEYWGEWQASSPKFREVQKVAPFARWYLNSMRFIYATMPLHHPMKTGLLTAIEGATKEQREAEGQGYKGVLKLGPSQLPYSQQGSIPFGGGRLGAEYYTPPGAVASGPEGILGSILPYASGAWSVAHGTNPLTGKELLETVEGKKRPVTDQGKLALLGAIAAAESFIPPLRYAKGVGKESAAHVFRPFKTEKTRFQGGKAERASQGPEVREGRGASEGSSAREGQGARETR